MKSKLFDIDAIDQSADTIKIAAHGFATGDLVDLFAGGNTAITDLTDNTIYTVDTIDDATFRLKDGTGAVIQIAQGPARWARRPSRASRTTRRPRPDLASVDPNPGPSTSGARLRDRHVDRGELHCSPTKACDASAAC